MFIAACVKKGVQPCKGGMFICVVAKTLLKITKLTRMEWFCGVLAQILPTRGKICLCFTFAICILTTPNIARKLPNYFFYGEAYK